MEIKLNNLLDNLNIELYTKGSGRENFGRYFEFKVVEHLSKIYDIPYIQKEEWVEGILKASVKYCRKMLKNKDEGKFIIPPGYDVKYDNNDCYVVWQPIHVNHYPDIVIVNEDHLIPIECKTIEKKSRMMFKKSYPRPGVWWAMYNRTTGARKMVDGNDTSHPMRDEEFTKLKTEVYQIQQKIRDFLKTKTYDFGDVKVKYSLNEGLEFKANGSLV